MNELKNTTALVKSLLEKDKKCRNSDSYLYLEVIEAIAKRDEWCITLQGMSVSYFLLNMSQLGVPAFETVRRARQKLQASYPELASCDKVQEGRLEKELEYRAFATEII